VSEIASEKNSTTFFPLPLDLLKPVLGAYRESQPAAPLPAPLAHAAAQAALGAGAPGAALPPAGERQGAERRG